MFVEEGLKSYGTPFIYGDGKVYVFDEMCLDSHDDFLRVRFLLPTATGPMGLRGPKRGSYHGTKEQIEDILIDDFVRRGLVTRLHPKKEK